MWAWEDFNFRPPAYQACATTTHPPPPPTPPPPTPPPLPPTPPLHPPPPPPPPPPVQALWAIRTGSWPPYGESLPATYKKQ
ncbi:MAG: hypothetical protein BalsKO_21080 [Balneolaceae bacterium]